MVCNIDNDKENKQASVSDWAQDAKIAQKKQEDGNTKTLETRFAFLCPPGSPSNPRFGRERSKAVAYLLPLRCHNCAIQNERAKMQSRVRVHYMDETMRVVRIIYFSA